MKKFALALVVFSLFVSAKPMFADAIGSAVTGALYLGNNTAVNYFDPQNGQVPTGSGNSTGATLTIGTGAVAFDYAKSVVVGTVPVLGTPITQLDTVVAAFTGNQLVVTTVAPISLGNFELDFTDDAFAGATLDNVLEAGLNPFGDTGSVVGNTLRVLIGAGVGLNVYSFTVNCDPATPASVTPEPGSLLLMSTGLLAAAGVMMSRRRMLIWGE